MSMHVTAYIHDNKWLSTVLHLSEVYQPVHALNSQRNQHSDIDFKSFRLVF